ncbi:MAG: Flp pilus assembly protein CpaB [Chloroflexi bacterium RBG_16_47_49]|nr:MAG: Flp pilus assembly protein CpaB [Chloroflexi bacterium RBG_16_47_49]
MNRRIRNGILIVLVGLAVIALGVFVTGREFWQRLALPPPPAPQTVNTERVVVSTHDIKPGTVLKAEDLRFAEMPVGLAPAGAITNLEAAIGKFAKADLVVGEMILDHKLADPTNVSHDVGFMLDDNEVLMAFPASDLMSTLNVIQRGDLVDIFASMSQEVPKKTAGSAELTSEQSQETEKYTFTFDALQRVQITAMVIDVVAGKRNGSLPLDGSENLVQPDTVENKTRAYLLALSPQDALVLKHLKDIGATFDIVLRAPTSHQLFEVQPVMSDYLLDRYELKK